MFRMMTAALAASGVAAAASAGNSVEVGAGQTRDLSAA